METVWETTDVRGSQQLASITREQALGLMGSTESEGGMWGEGVTMEMVVNIYQPKNPEAREH